MRQGPSSDLISGAAEWGVRVSSWLGSTVVAESVPILSGRFTADASQKVPERVTFTVPRWDGRDWNPGIDPTHPLARFGQYVQVTIVMRSLVDGLEYETALGRFYIQDWKYDSLDGVIRVEALGVLQRAAEDRLTSPLAPLPSGTLASEFRRLLPLGLSASISPELTNRACPRSMEWADERIDALYEIADAWPARVRADQWGQLALLPPLPEVPTPVITLKDGEGGTVVGASRSDTRDQAYNRIVVRASSTDSPDKRPIQAVVDQTSGPMRVGGPYGPVTKYWSSPLITTVAQARKSGETLLANSLRPSRTVPVTIAPDPRLELDDAVEVISDGARDWGYITAFDIPLTVNDGAMRVDIGVV